MIFKILISANKTVPNPFVPTSFRDPIWSSYCAIIAIIAITIQVIFYYKKRRRKQFSYKILSKNRIFQLTQPIEDLEFRFRDNIVEQIHLIKIQMKNSGNIDILPGEYDKPISISFGDAQILTVEIIDKDPDSLIIAFQIEENIINIQNTLLNKGDSYALQILVSDFDNIINVDGRIIGIQNIIQLQ